MTTVQVSGARSLSPRRQGSILVAGAPTSILGPLHALVLVVDGQSNVRRSPSAGLTGRAAPGGLDGGRPVEFGVSRQMAPTSEHRAESGGEG